MTDDGITCRSDPEHLPGSPEAEKLRRELEVEREARMAREGAAFKEAQRRRHQEATANSAWPKEAKQGLTIVLCVVVFLGALVWAFMRGCAQDRAYRSAHGDGFGAFLIAQEFAKERIQLISPGTAEWPSASNANEEVKALGSERFEVRSWVDSQNLFGALVRTNYHCIVQYVGAAKWTLESFGLGDKETAEELERREVTILREANEDLREGDVAVVHDNDRTMKAGQNRAFGAVSIEASNALEYADDATVDQLVRDGQVFRLEAGTHVILVHQDSPYEFDKWVSVASDGPNFSRVLLVSGPRYLTELYGDAAFAVRATLMALQGEDAGEASRPARIETAPNRDLGLGIQEPVPLESPQPAYPRLALRAGEEGSVLCRLDLSDRGIVTKVEVIESSGFTRLDDAARETLATWRFEPRRVDGVPVASTVEHRVTFRSSK